MSIPPLWPTQTIHNKVSHILIMIDSTDHSLDQILRNVEQCIQHAWQRQRFINVSQPKHQISMRHVILVVPQCRHHHDQPKGMQGDQGAWNHYEEWQEMPGISQTHENCCEILNTPAAGTISGVKSWHSPLHRGIKVGYKSVTWTCLHGTKVKAVTSLKLTTYPLTINHVNGKSLYLWTMFLFFSDSNIHVQGISHCHLWTLKVPAAARPTAEKLAEDALRRLMPTGNATFSWVILVPYSMHGAFILCWGHGNMMEYGCYQSSSILEVHTSKLKASAWQSSQERGQKRGCVLCRVHRWLSIACHTLVWL